tara:strand:+ start:7034 stop:8167 length:1134 start_codon:yes stop_codon:yes gene_type:complete
MVMVSIPLPKYNLSSQTVIVLVITWILLNPLSEKYTLFKKNKKHFFILSIPFFLAMLGLTYSNNFNVGINKLGLQILFIIFPLIFSTINTRFIDREKVISYFPIGVFISALFGACKASFFLLNNLGNYFYYDRFALFLNKHTTYFSLFVVLAILFVIHQLIHKKIEIRLSVILLLLFVPLIYILSVRISILALLIGVMPLLVYHLKIKYIVGLLISLPVLLGLIYLTPNFQKRFEKSTIEDRQIEDVDFRKLHWESVLETISHNSLLVGNGSGSNRDYLYNKYREYKLTAAYENKYNAHNQFLEVLLNYGFFGLLFFLFLLIYLAILFINSKNSLAISFLLTLIIFMLTESILERHSGVIIFTLFMSLFVKTDLESN